MSNKKNTMVPVGTRGDYEVYEVVPCSIEDSMAMEAEISTHYEHDTNGIYGSGDDISTKNITIGGRSYEYVLFGDDDQAPYKNQALIEKNMVMSQCQNFNILTCYGQGIRFLDRETKEVSEDPEIRRFCLTNAIHRLWLRMSTDMKYHFFSVMVIYLSRDHKRIKMVRMRNAADCRFTKRNEYGVCSLGDLDSVAAADVVVVAVGHADYIGVIAVLKGDLAGWVPADVGVDIDDCPGGGYHLPGAVSYPVDRLLSHGDLPYFSFSIPAKVC